MNSANGGPHVGFQCIGANATSTIGNMLARNDMQLYTYCVWTPRHNTLFVGFLQQTLSGRRIFVSCHYQNFRMDFPRHDLNTLSRFWKNCGHYMHISKISLGSADSEEGAQHKRECFAELPLPTVKNLASIRLCLVCGIQVLFYVRKVVDKPSCRHHTKAKHASHVLLVSLSCLCNCCVRHLCRTW